MFAMPPPYPVGPPPCNRGSRQASINAKGKDVAGASATRLRAQTTRAVAAASVDNLCYRHCDRRQRLAQRLDSRQSSANRLGSGAALWSNAKLTLIGAEHKRRSTFIPSPKNAHFSAGSTPGPCWPSSRHRRWYVIAAAETVRLVAEKAFKDGWTPADWRQEWN